MNKGDGPFTTQVIVENALPIGLQSRTLAGVRNSNSRDKAYGHKMRKLNPILGIESAFFTS